MHDFVLTRVVSTNCGFSVDQLREATGAGDPRGSAETCCFCVGGAFSSYIFSCLGRWGAYGGDARMELQAVRLW